MDLPLPCNDDNPHAPYRFGINTDGRYQVLTEDQLVQEMLVVWPSRARIDPTGIADLARGFLRGWIDKGLPHQCRDGVRYFDSCQVSNFQKWLSRTGRDDCYLQYAVLIARRLVTAAMSVDPPAISGEHDPCRISLTLRREFNLEYASSASPRLRIPLPFEDQTQKDIEVTLIEPQPRDAQITRRPGYLEVRLKQPVPRPAIEVRISYTAFQQSFQVYPALIQPVLSGPERELYTRPREGPIQITDAIVSLAKTLPGSARDPWTAVVAAWEFFFHHMISGGVHHDEFDPADPLGSLVQRQWFDCYWASALLAALLRAKQIPTRTIAGFMLLDHVAGLHYWTEVLLPPYGWVPFDLLSWHLAAGRLDAEPWSRLFFGRLDYRLKCECYPRVVVGMPGVRFPNARYVRLVLQGEGSETSHWSLVESRWFLRDQVVYTQAPIG